MSESTDYKTLQLGRSGKVALVDAEDYPRLSVYRWHICRRWKRKYVRRLIENSSSVQLTHDVLNLPKRVTVRYINGDTLDCRKANLQSLYGCAYRVKNPYYVSRPFRVAANLENVQYNAGYFATCEEAERVSRILGETLAGLRGRYALPRARGKAMGGDVLAPIGCPPINPPP